VSIEVPHAIVISVILRPASSLDEERVCLFAVLSGVASPTPIGEGDFTFFPVLLIKGTKNVTLCTIRWLQQQFDCRISSLTFAPHHLAQMASIWAIAPTPSNHPSSHGNIFELTYHVPAHIQGLRSIKLTISAADVRRLCLGIAAATSSSTQAAEGKDSPTNSKPLLLTALEQHFWHGFRIALGAMSLVRVTSPIAFIGSEGRIKFAPEAAEAVLQVLDTLP
jgi:hypothetical protein